MTVEAGGVTPARQLFPAKGYLSSVELPLTFGLGSAAKADAVTIVWPSGKTTELPGLVGGQTNQDRRARCPDSGKGSAATILKNGGLSEHETLGSAAERGCERRIL